MANKNRKKVNAYNPVEIERLRNVSLPAKLKCNMCLKNYNQANFSEKQLNDVRRQVSETGMITKNPKCIRCTGGQLVEIECVMCHKTKGLEEFAKTQRKKPDDAICFDCTAIQVEREAINETDYEDPNKAFFRSATSDGSYPEYFSSASSARDTASSAGDWEDTESTNGGGIDVSENFKRTMSVNDSVPGALIDSEYSTPVTPSMPGTWSEVAGTESFHTNTAPSTRSAFDPNRYANPSARSTTGSMHSYSSSVAERSQSGHGQVEMKNGFAKIKAYKPQKQEDPFFEDEEEKESSSSDDDDYSDDDTVI